MGAVRVMKLGNPPGAQLHIYTGLPAGIPVKYRCDPPWGADGSVWLTCHPER